jgi:drug/metabolite transporter (DMT)-like permease
MSIPWTAVAIAVLVNTLWGANPIAVKLSLESFPPLYAAFIRFSIGLACVSLWAAVAGIRLRPHSGELKPMLMLASLFAVQITLMNFGFQRTTGALSSVLIATYPFFAAMLSHFIIADDRMSWIRAIGLGIAFTGTAGILLGSKPDDQIELIQIGNWITLASAGLLGTRMVLSAHLVRHIEPARVMFWQMLFSLPMFLIPAIATESISLDAITWRASAGMLYQGIVIAGIGFMVLAYLLKHYAPSVMVAFGFVTPISGVALSALILEEQISSGFVLGLLAVAVGLVLTVRPASPSPDPVEPDDASPSTADTRDPGDRDGTRRMARR